MYSSTSSFVTDFLSFKNLSKPVNFNSSVFTPGVFEIIFKISLPGAFFTFNFFTASDKAENTLGPYFNVAPTAAVPRAPGPVRGAEANTTSPVVLMPFKRGSIIFFSATSSAIGGSNLDAPISLAISEPGSICAPNNNISCNC